MSLLDSFEQFLGISGAPVAGQPTTGDLYDQFHTNAAGTSALQSSADQLHGTAQTYQRNLDKLHKAVQNTRQVYKGRGGSGMAAAFDNQLTSLSSGAEYLSTHASAANRQVQQWTAARDKMVKPPPQPSQAQMLAVSNDPGQLAADPTNSTVAETMKQHGEVQQQNQAAYRTYTGQSRDNTASAQGVRLTDPTAIHGGAGGSGPQSAHVAGSTSPASAGAGGGGGAAGYPAAAGDGAPSGPGHQYASSAMPSAGHHAPPSTGAGGTGGSSAPGAGGWNGVPGSTSAQGTTAAPAQSGPGVSGGWAPETGNGGNTSGRAGFGSGFGPVNGIGGVGGGAAAGEGGAGRSGARFGSAAGDEAGTGRGGSRVGGPRSGVGASEEAMGRGRGVVAEEAAARGRGGAGGMAPGGAGGRKEEDEEHHNKNKRWMTAENAGDIVGDLEPTAPPVIE